MSVGMAEVSLGGRTKEIPTIRIREPRWREEGDKCFAGMCWNGAVLEVMESGA